MNKLAHVTAALVAALTFLFGPRAVAEDASLKPSRIAAALQPFVDRHELAGAVAVVASKEKVLAVEAVGFADLAVGKPMPENALFWIASQTKPMTATALMMLVDEGKVGVNEPVEKYLPEFKGQLMTAEKDEQHVLLTPVTQLHYPLDEKSARFPMPAGGLFSTGHDVARFCQLMLNGGTLDGRRYISEATLKQMTSRQTAARIPDSYGFGWSVGDGWFGHGGAYATNMTVDSAHGLVFVYLVQHAGFPGAGAKAHDAFRKAATEQFGGTQLIAHFTHSSRGLSHAVMAELGSFSRVTDGGRR